MATIPQVIRPDGRVELGDEAALRDSQYYNAELAPVPVAERTWSTYSYFALWVANLAALLRRIRDRTRIDLADLYDRRGRYWFSGGWNWRALVATAVGAVLAVGGAYGGPFPDDGLIPFLKVFYDYSWVVAIAAAMAVYLVLALVSERPVPAALPQPQEGEARA